MSEASQPEPADTDSKTGEATTLRMGEVDITLGPESRREDFKTGAIGFTDVTISGLWHLSARDIERFENEKGTDQVSKHGPGTYVGGGRLGGTNLEALRMEDHNRYDLKFRGNVLVASFDVYDDVAWELEEILAADGVDLPMHKPGHMINTALRGHEINGVRYDAFLLYADPQAGEQGLAEGVVFYPEQNLEIVGQTAVPRE